MHDQTLTELAQEAYYIARSKGFYHPYQSINLLREKVLILTELAEAINAERSGRYSRKRTVSLLLPMLIYRWRYKRSICGTVEDEIADALLRVLTLNWHYFSDTPVFYEDMATPLNLPELCTTPHDTSPTIRTSAINCRQCTPSYESMHTRKGLTSHL